MSLQSMSLQSMSLQRDSAAAAALHDPEDVLSIILDPKRRGTLYPYFHRLRELAPLHRTEQATGRPAWVVSSYAYVREVLRHPSTWSDHRGVELFDVGPAGEQFCELQRNTLLFLEPKKHDRVRGLISRAFTPRSVQLRRDRIQEILDGLIDRVLHAGRMDVVKDYGYLLPVVVICEMLGVPTEDLQLFYQWAHDSHRRGEIGEVTDEVIRKGEESAAGYRDYFLGLIEEHRKAPRFDLMTALIEAVDEDGARLDDEDLVGSCYILLQAGHGTTADLIGTGTLALLRNPDQLEIVRRAPGAIQPAVEELLRYDTSVQISQRVSDVPLVIGDATIAPGEVCVLFNGAANRDPAEFPDPDRLDVTRNPNPHITFGLGRHTCLGQSLARMELQAAVATLLRRLPDLALTDEEPVYRNNLFLRGLSKLPVTF